MLGIVALESRRAGAFVVGEDLGTVEPAVRQELRRRNVLSFRVLWFEKDRPAAYPALAMAAATTHDLPTVAGLWTGRDAAELREIGAGDPESFDKVRAKFQEQSGLPDGASPAEAVETAYRLLGEAPSVALLATLEDALAVEERPNVPGTTGGQRANWSIALPGGLEALETAELPRRIARALRRPSPAGDISGDTIHDF
jgi:4-alpha-glucanotransferase